MIAKPYLGYDPAPITLHEVTKLLLDVDDLRPVLFVSSALKERGDLIANHINNNFFLMSPRTLSIEVKTDYEPIEWEVKGGKG